jgi:hypothetical protein
MLSPSPCRFPRMSRLHPRAPAPATPLPPYNDASRRFSRSTFSEPPRIRFWRPQATMSSKRSKNAQNTHTAYNELVASAAPTTSRPHPPPRSRPRPKPGHHDLAAQALTTRRAVPFLRASGSSAIASSTPPHITHDPRTSPRLLNRDSTPIRATLYLRNAFTYCRHSAQLHLSPCFRRARRQPPRDTAP